MLAFGDGLFETCLITRQGLRFSGDHLQRLQEGVARLGLTWSGQDQRALESDIATLLKTVDAPAVLKITLGRHAAGRGYDYDPATQQTDRLLQVFEYQPAPWYESGARLVTSPIPASVNAALAGIKHLNRLDSVLARQTARSLQAHEALLCDDQGWVVEGSMSNVFYCHGGQWLTPGLKRAGVNGIIRRRWLDSGHEALGVADIRPDDLANCDALLIGNALMGLVRVTHFNDVPLPLADPIELASLQHRIGLNLD